MTTERNVISVRADRSAAGHGDGVDEVLVCERPHSVLERQIYVSDNLDTDRMQAEYKNGVLTLRLPLSEKSKPRRVSVTGASETTEVRSGDGMSDQAQSGGRSEAGRGMPAGSSTTQS